MGGKCHYAVPRVQVIERSASVRTSPALLRGITRPRSTVDASTRRDCGMSRAFVNEDAGADPEPRYILPKRDHPSYDEAAAWVLLEGADAGDSRSAELATGYKWGEARLRPHVEAILARAREQEDERLHQLAERYLNT